MNSERPAYIASQWWIALTVILAGLVYSVDSVSVSIAIPNMMTSLRADLDQIQWVVTISMLVQTLIMPTTGWLIEVLGPRALFLASLILVSSGTVLCSLAWSLESLLVFRIVQGLGFGPLQPVCMAILYRTFPPAQRGMAIGLVNMSPAVGVSLGRLSGGFLVDTFDWRMVFYLTLCFSVATVVLGVFLIPREARQPRQVTVDIWGICAMGGFLVPLMLALTQGRLEGWDSPYIGLLFALAGVSFLAFITIELQGHAPVVDLRLYTNFNFALGSLVQFMVSVLFMSSTFLVTIFLQQVSQYTPSQVGVLTFHEGWIFGVGALLAGPLADRTDPRLPLVCGLVGFAIVYFWLGGISAVTTPAILVGMLCVRSFSYGWVNAPNMLMTLRTLPEDQVGMATGLFSVARSISGTLGVALSATLLEHQRATHTIALAQQQGGLELPSQWAMTSLQQTFASLGEETSVAQVQATAYLHHLMVAEATMTAYQDIFLLSGLIALGNILLGLLRTRRDGVRAPSGQEAPSRAEKRGTVSS
jgi:DHA2 family multidrug resistance protein